MRTNTLSALLCALLFASVAHAGPITASSSGCVSSLPDGASWVGPAEGFVFFAAWDDTAGCGPTTRNPTQGFHLITASATEYRVDVLAKWLPTCGRVQFDAQGYTATGLSPEVHALVFDTGVNCVPKPGSGLVPMTELGREPVEGWPPVDHPGTPTLPDDPIVRVDDGPPCVHQPCIIPTPPVTTVPDGSSTLLLSLLVVGCLRWAR